MWSEEYFKKLREELANIDEIPIGWGGRKQNNADDDKINLFKIDDYSTLMSKIDNLNDNQREYYIKRWFMIKVSEFDEFIFSKLPNTKRNPSRYSKKYDLNICGYEFDIKGTRVPYKYINSLNWLYSHPKELINYYYSNQSRGRRYGIQNRLFVVTVDEDDYKNELRLRLEFEIKEKIFLEYINKIKNGRNFFRINLGSKIVYSDIIFIIKNGNSIESKIASDLIN